MSDTRPNTKTRSSYYTPERVAALRQNADEFAWAAEEKADAVGEADAVLEGGLMNLWSSVTSQAIPRCFRPGGGSTRQEWDAVEGRSWKVTNGEWTLPTNDFGTYRQSGLDNRGMFDPALADDALLVNEEHPEMGEGWGVDDGYGWIDTEGDVGDPGTTWTPVAYYNHYSVWYEIRQHLVTLRDAYLHTGEPEYARAGTVLLDRIADVYPEMDISEYSHDTFPNSHGFTGQGRITGSIWETGIVRDVVSAYDAFFPEQDDTELVSFLELKSSEYEALPPKSSVEDVRRNIEENVVREILPAVERAEIRGNLGMHHSALAMSAVVADDPDGYTADALEFLFRAGGLRTVDGEDWSGDVVTTLEQTWRLTGGDLAPALVDRLDRDGYGDEAAPNYNTIIQRQLGTIADILRVYDKDVDHRTNLYEHPKVKQSARSHYDLIFLDRYVPSIGDSGKTGDPGISLQADLLARYYEIYGDPLFARVACLLNGRSVEGSHGDPFSPRAGELAGKIAAAVEREGSFSPDSTVLPGYGFAALRHGERSSDRGDRRRGTWLYYGRNSPETGRGHTHRDALNLGLYAHDLDLAPDLGYPEQTGEWPKKLNWTTNTVSHNTVVVDEEPQHPQRVGVPHHFDDGDRVTVFEASASRVYPQTDAYRRTTAQISIDDTDSYVFDAFHVSGGDDHLFSFHAAEGDVTTTGVDLDPQLAGTYAGAGVPFPNGGEETDYSNEVGSGFNYLRNVRRDRDPRPVVSIDWSVEDTWNVRGDEGDVHLRLTMVGDIDDIAIASGEPPQNEEGNPDHLEYLLARRRGEDLDTTFTSVIEPYEGDSRIRTIEPVPVISDGAPVSASGVTAVAVELVTGRTDYIVRGPDDDSTYRVGETFEFDGAFAVYSEVGDKPTFAHLVGGTHLRSLATGETIIERESVNWLAGEIADFTRELRSKNSIVLDVDQMDPGANLAGRHLYVEVEGDQNGVYEIDGVAERDDGRLEVDIGRTTLIRRFEDPERPESGYVHNIEVGARAKVPAVGRWRPEG